MPNLINKRRSLLLMACLCLIATCFLPGLCYAATGEPSSPSSKGQGASVGTLLAAALETGGYKALSHVYRDLWGIIHSLGALFYAFCLLAALISVTVFHSYEMGLWFFIGPALFFFVNGQFVRSSGAEWQFGEFVGEHKKIDKVLNETVDAEVPWVFHEYNRLISSVVQSLIRIITNKSISDQVLFMTRPTITDELIDTEVKNEGLRSLIKLGLQTDCARFMHAARTIALGNRDRQFQGTSEYQTAAAEYDRLYTEKNKSLSGNSLAVNYVTTILGSLEKLGNAEQFIDKYCSEPKPRGPSPNDDLKADLRLPPAQVLEQPTSCRQIWCWTAMGLSLEVTALQKEAERHIPPDPLAQSKKQTGQDLTKEIWKDIALKFTPPKQQASIQPDVSAIPVIIGGILLRKTLLNDPRSQTISELADHIGYDTTQHNFDVNARTEQLQRTFNRAPLHLQAQDLRYEIFHLVMMLPYLQGAVLYLCALTFPFFSLLLLIPNKASSFFSWMALWAWAKSWDVGWALVMVADRILWQLMPHNSTYNFIGDSNHTPITILESAFAPDGTYSLAFYYTLLLTMLISVPLLSAQLFLGGNAFIASHLTNGAHNMGKALGGAAADWHRGRYLHQISALREKGAANYVQQRLKHGVMANEELKQAMQQATAILEHGKEQGGAGPMTRAALLGILGGDPAKSVMAQQQAATQEQRLGNALKVINNHLNAEVHKYQWSYSPEATGLETMRAMLSGRHEKWETYQNAPLSALAGLARQNIVADVQRSQIEGKRVGSVYVENFTRALSRAWSTPGNTQ